MGYSFWLFRTQDSLNIARPALIRPEWSARRTVRDWLPEGHSDESIWGSRLR
jgi:hypothetical protein